MDTPGHTPDGQCCAVYSHDDLDKPKLLFTGDVLFVGSVGRPDLMEGTVSAAWLASAMYGFMGGQAFQAPGQRRHFSGSRSRFPLRSPPQR